MRRSAASVRSGSIGPLAPVAMVGQTPPGRRQTSRRCSSIYAAASRSGSIRWSTAVEHRQAANPKQMHPGASSRGPKPAWPRGSLGTADQSPPRKVSSLPRCQRTFPGMVEALRELGSGAGAAYRGLPVGSGGAALSRVLAEPLLVQALDAGGRRGRPGRGGRPVGKKLGCRGGEAWPIRGCVALEKVADEAKDAAVVEALEALEALRGSGARRADIEDIEDIVTRRCHHEGNFSVYVADLGGRNR